jgi:glutathione peroxidase-family protein
MKTNTLQNSKQNLLYPHHNYRGTFTPNQLMFNANLQEFSQKVTYIVNFETNGQLTAGQAYQELETLWEKIKECRLSLEIS